MAMRALGILRVIFICAALLSSSDAYSSFTPTCTLPPPGTNYVSGPNVRSSLTILWNCLSIIILCTWSIQHFNIPAIRPEAKSWLQKLRWAILDSRSKAKWMLFTILVPEFLVGKALGEYRAARYGCKGVDWSMIHSYMANMGYFVLDWGVLSDSSPGEGTTNQTRSSSEIIAEKNSGGERAKIISEMQAVVDDSIGVEDLSSSTAINLSRLKSRYWALDSNQWGHLFQRKIVQIPDIATSQLEKLDRGGVLVKILALVQTSYLIMQLIARKVYGLPSAQIEIAALAFSACSIVTYLLYWNRPQGVETVHIIKAEKKVSGEDLQNLLATLSHYGPRYLWLTPRTEKEFYPELGPDPIPNDANHYTDLLPGRGLFEDNDEIMSLAFGSIFGGALFGGLHCLAWNFHFPTPGEALGWRICSIATTCLPVLSLIPTWAWMKLNPFYGGHEGSKASRVLVAVIGLGLFVVPYVLARLFLMIEIFRTLCFLPPDAFVDTWSGSFPHLG
jgi:hypothetical protein